MAMKKYIYTGTGGSVYLKGRSKPVNLSNATQAELKILFNKNYTGVSEVEDKKETKAKRTTS